MRTVTLSFDQSRSDRETRNRVVVALDNIDFETDRLEYTWLHVNDPLRPEPYTLDAYMFAFVVFAMQRADRLIVEGPLTARALRNVETFAEAWRAWHPGRFGVPQVDAERVISDDDVNLERARLQRGGRAVSTFSGGVDSIFTALRHAPSAHAPSRHRVTDVVIVHGFDVPVDRAAEFEQMIRRVEPLLNSLDLHHRVVRTDVRRRLQQTWEAQPWEESFGAQLAGVLHQFSDTFEFGLIASGQPVSAVQTAWGSTPMTDPLLSGGLLDVVNDGAGYTRIEKVARVAQHEVATRTVRVCWEGSDLGRNCGACEKCVRTRLNFAAVGHPDPACFDTPLDVHLIKRLRPRSQPQYAELRRLIEYADQRNDRSLWVDTLRERLLELEAGVGNT